MTVGALSDLDLWKRKFYESLGSLSSDGRTFYTCRTNEPRLVIQWGSSVSLKGIHYAA